MQNESWKKQFLLIGALAGALVGAATAYLMIRTAEENNSGPPQITTGDALKTGLNVIGIVRAIAALGGGR
jgi:gas vesicle protein